MKAIAWLIPAVTAFFIWFSVWRLLMLAFMIQALIKSLLWMTGIFDLARL